MLGFAKQVDKCNVQDLHVKLNTSTAKARLTLNVRIN
jgi:hypothetical protein